MSDKNTEPGAAADTAQAHDVIARVLEAARAAGADAAEASVSIASGLSAGVRLGEVETLEHHRDKRLGVSVYLGGRKGTAASSDFTPEAIETTVAAAMAIARHTNPDPCAGLVEPELMAKVVPDLDLYHPWALEPEQAIAIALACEEAARGVDPRITNSEGASLSYHEGVHAYGNSHGFIGSWPSTRAGLDCTLIAADKDGMQRDFWYTVARRSDALEAPEVVGRMAAQRTLARLGARKLETCTTPVIFEARAATTLFAHFIGAISGSSLYRKASFLLDRLGTQVFAPHVEVREEPHLPQALGSAPFDNDGVATQPRAIVEKGVLQGYVLSGYSARKLGMRTTGNAGGVHNLIVSHGDEDLDGLLRRMGTGLLVTELMGFGVNQVTGDYSRGASGFWIENGERAFPVEEITIAGNLKDMFLGIEAIGSDVELRGNIRTGSVLIGSMTVAGK